jgi:hypothetical protein
LDFLDGRLASPDEEELLHTLSVSPERRQVMREHMKLREVTSTIARQDRLTVPEYVTDQLFSKLEGMGYSAPLSTEALLSRTPEYVSVAGAAAVATAVGSGWRIGAISLLTASIMSFILGAGAYYVFGSSLGLRTRSQELADAKRHAITRHYASSVAPVAAPQFDVALAQPVSHSVANVIANGTKNVTGNAANVSSSISAAPVEAGFIGPVNMVGPLAASSNDNSIASGNSDANSSNDIASSGIPISYTPPVKTSYAASVTAPKPLTDLEPFWPSVIPSPLEKENGTIGLQYSGGPGPDKNSSAVQWSNLTELKVGFTLWNYFAGSASMGYLSTFEKVAQGALEQNVKVGSTNYSNAYVINTSGTNVKTATLMGFEGGITLDHIGVPIAAMAGIMTSMSTTYYRGSIMMRFEPFQDMVVSAGIEALWYTHDLGISTQEQSEYPNNNYKTVNPSGVTSETCGLIGPSIELGWHF